MRHDTPTRFSFLGGSDSRRNACTTRHASRSTRPVLEVMEGRQLMAAAASIYASSASVVEYGTGPVTMNFQINLTAASTQPVTVNYQTSDNTAINGTDYLATSGTLTFAPGTKTATVPVTVLVDLAATSNRAFSLNLSGAQGATLATPRLAGTIVEQNRPTPPSLSIANVVSNVGTDALGGTITFTVQLNVPSTAPVTVTATTKDLTAFAGVDYVAKSQVLIFAPGQMTAQFTVNVLGESAVSTKYMLVNLTGASVALGNTQAAGTIVWTPGVAPTAQLAHKAV